MTSVFFEDHDFASTILSETTHTAVKQPKFQCLSSVREVYGQGRVHIFDEILVSTRCIRSDSVFSRRFRNTLIFRSRPLETKGKPNSVHSQMVNTVRNAPCKDDYQKEATVGAYQHRKPTQSTVSQTYDLREISNKYGIIRATIMPKKTDIYLHRYYTNIFLFRSPEKNYFVSPVTCFYVTVTVLYNMPSP